jgi:hypothetical protein
MKMWTSLTAVLSLSVSAFGLEGCPPVRAQAATAAVVSAAHGSANARGSATAPESASPADPAAPSQTLPWHDVAPGGRNSHDPGLDC